MITGTTGSISQITVSLLWQVQTLRSSTWVVPPATRSAAESVQRSCASASLGQ